jgi:hypothetical protein
MGDVYFSGMLEVIRCGGCGIHYGVPDYWIEERREDGKGFNCPNGCCRAFPGKAKRDKTREAEKAAAKAKADAEHAAAMRDIAERTCPWPTCDGRVLASPRGLRQHMVKAHGAPWASPELDIEEVGQVLNGRDPEEVVR